MDRTTIVVYVDDEGVDSMVEHILDGSLKQYKPSLTVGATIHVIPVLDRNGRSSLNPKSDNYEGNN